MNLRDFVISDENIYLAIYAVKSYVFDPQLLNRKDKKLLMRLSDPFNESLILQLIEKIRGNIVEILDTEKLFDVQVYFKPKDYRDLEAIYRPIHTAALEQLITMVSLLQPLIYEIPNDEDGRIYLSNYSRLIPQNFYGNRVSKKPEELFERWNIQYKKYTQKANEYLKTFYESHEYKYEVKLDLKNFFPSVDPQIIYGILTENMPITFKGEDVKLLKKIIYKLLICKVTNITSALAKQKYYGVSEIEECYTKGIAQGLPQSYFFGNMCMIKIASIFEEALPGKSVYYVDDSYIYTNKSANEEDLNEIIEVINKKITDLENDYKIKNKGKCTFLSDTEYNRFFQYLQGKNESKYGIMVHTDKKVASTEIKGLTDGEIYLRTISREASKIGADIMSLYSEEEETTVLNRTRALLLSIQKELDKLDEEKDEREAYQEKLMRYYKFFKYREIKLQLRQEKNIDKFLFETLVPFENTENYEANKETSYELLKREVTQSFFFEEYKNDIWQVAIAMLISNSTSDREHRLIRDYIKRIIKVAYNREMLECSYIQREYEDYLEKRDSFEERDHYSTLKRSLNKKMQRFVNYNKEALKKEFCGLRLCGIKEDILSSYEICSSKFIKCTKLVLSNSSRLQRMFLNALYSKIFKVDISDTVVLNSYDKKGITYGELRTLIYLRNEKCNISYFLNWNLQLMEGENAQNIDYSLFEVLGAYKKYVSEPTNIDKLILTHKYTCDIWKNGAKHLYFYTLHNQEHAVDLVKNIIKIVKTISYIKITYYDYYLLFLACYLHDISMVKIASKNDFVLDEGESDAITTNAEIGFADCKNSSDIKYLIYDTYKQVDDFFEKKIRSSHGTESAAEIRKQNDLCFLEPSVREAVAEIAESHMRDGRDVFYTKGDAKEKLISYKFDKILLRFADLLDMSERRVSQPILNHNMDNISELSAFHWVSHLLTEGYELVSTYIRENDEMLMPGSITEQITLTIWVKLSQLSKHETNSCSHGKVLDESISKKGFLIELNEEGARCESPNCNFLCRWFNKKNDFLVMEMQALEAYLNRVPKKERFYNTKIIIKVVISNPTTISDKQFEILKKQIEKG